jgi:hypothetical protein
MRVECATTLSMADEFARILNGQYDIEAEFGSACRLALELYGDGPTPVIDLGANQGAFLTYLKAIGAEGSDKWIAVEPVKRNAKLLNMNAPECVLIDAAIVGADYASDTIELRSGLNDGCWSIDGAGEVEVCNAWRCPKGGSYGVVKADVEASDAAVIEFLSKNEWLYFCGELHSPSGVVDALRVCDPVNAAPGLVERKESLGSGPIFFVSPETHSPHHTVKILSARLMDAIAKGAK